MSTHKAGGKASQHVSPAGKRLGMKASDGEKVSPGMILVRQRGTKIKIGRGVASGRDHTVYAIIKGKVKFTTKLGRKVISVI
ncbi:MAG TPA: 50S ribosomal protein L27 [Patescibacteria group bacterium]|nr:50S ribosomal protein L27 [Patescibacteria group bacterium]